MVLLRSLCYFFSIYSSLIHPFTLKSIGKLPLGMYVTSKVIVLDHFERTNFGNLMKVLDTAPLNNALTHSNFILSSRSL